MRSIALLIGIGLLALACVDPEELTLTGTKDLLVVEGTITNLPEAQIIKLSQAQADRLTGQFSTSPLTKASVEVVVDSVQVVTCHETTDGNYQLPADFRGQVGHAYQLRFTLPNGTAYVSTQQVLPAVSPINKVSAQFNPTSLSPQQLKGYTAAHDIFIESQDPADQHNYYRWEWKLWQRQYWCHSCRQGVYTQYKVLPNVYRARDYFVTGTELYEDCFSPPAGKAGEEAPDVPKEDWIYDYGCRTPCWQILYGYDLVVFDDKFTNGSLISQQRVAQIPFYDPGPGLVDVRQLSLTPDAYRYYKLFQEQTQQAGGLADSPPTALGGNVHQVDKPQVSVVGYFSASGVSQVHYWLDRKDAKGLSYGSTSPIDTLVKGSYGPSRDGLFYALNERQPNLEPSPPYLNERVKAKVRLWPNADRPPLAPCLQSDRQTPFKPEGWRE
ncbi:DUF4249 domain-containing protein [Spirosoma radiotolerans]|uniref:DUF4249 domain-containing protein n=1 Tax=Spirosoma radiotolerans TaxID=1379870 RepID=A0A0E3V7U4_9BACT|nr:DUF4249 domain-containing protein [Spirosoma radiotolerans]AKD56167.1 hypothetical protein SD10_15945 [Spirosoma radiotolerans]